MWIDAFYTAHGMDREEFARRVRVLGARKLREKESKRSFPVNCSSELIYRLEMAKTPRTHQNIADLIAEACGASDAERDSIVAPMHRGTWHGDGVAKALGDLRPVNRRERHVSTERQYARYKPVVKIGRDGRVLDVYISMAKAATENRHSMDMVERRVHREIRDEFAPSGFSYRFASEWDGMSDTQKRMDIEQVRLTAKRRSR